MSVISLYSYKMKQIIKRRYFLAFTAAILALLGLLYNGILTWALPLYTFFLVPLVEFLIPPKDQNHLEAEEQELLADKTFDWILYAIVPIQYSLLIIFLFSMNSEMLAWERIGKIFTFGICCGIYGINVAHELGHRREKRERLMSLMLLLTSQYMHFYVEHNKGHHKYVSTKEDPASARLNEWIFPFWIRSITMGYISAWKIQLKELKQKKIPFFHFKNEMLRFLFIQILLILFIGFFFSWFVMLYYLASAGIGILLLETVNYIEHYGLERRLNTDGKYIAVKPIHSWNSDHLLGRGILFELSRHSDHHYKASRKYQILRSFENSPQMPTGYPGMIVLSMFPPLWFYTMNKKVDSLRKTYPEYLA